MPSFDKVLYKKNPNKTQTKHNLWQSWVCCELPQCKWKKTPKICFSLCRDWEYIPAAWSSFFFFLFSQRFPYKGIGRGISTVASVGIQRAPRRVTRVPPSQARSQPWQRRRAPTYQQQGATAWPGTALGRGQQRAALAQPLHLPGRPRGCVPSVPPPALPWAGKAAWEGCPQWALTPPPLPPQLPGKAGTRLPAPALGWGVGPWASVASPRALPCHPEPWHPASLTCCLTCAAGWADARAQHPQKWGQSRSRDNQIYPRSIGAIINTFCANVCWRNLSLPSKHWGALGCRDTCWCHLAILL